MDIDITIRIEITRVTRGKPTVRIDRFLRRLRLVPIGFHQGRALDLDFADIALRHHFASLVHDADFHARIGNAARAQLAEFRIMRMRRQMRRRACCFRQPVKLDEIAAERVLRLTQYIFGNGRRAIKNLPDRFHVRRLNRRLLHQKQNNGRHHEGDVDFFFFNQGQDQRRINILDDDVLGAMHIADQADIDARDVKERHTNEIDLAELPVGPAGILAAFQNTNVITVGELHALGVTRRAAGVKLDHIIIDISGQHRVFRRKAIAPIVKRGPCRMAPVERDHALDARALGEHPFDNGVKFRANKKHLGLGIIQHIGNFGWREPPVDTDHHRLRLERPVEHFKIAVRPLADKADARVGLQPFSDQPLRHLTGALVEFRVSRGAALKDLRHGAAVDAGVIARDIGHGINVLACEHNGPSPGVLMRGGPATFSVFSQSCPLLERGV